MSNVDDGELERVPCPDDMCTGTINERGVCSYCGRAGSGVPARSAVDEVRATFGTDLVAGLTPGTVAPAEDDGERVPCSDDMCTGTIGERGACNYCGKPARA